MTVPPVPTPDAEATRANLRDRLLARSNERQWTEIGFLLLEAREAIAAHIAEKAAAEARAEKAEKALREADLLAEAGLCCFSFENARGYLQHVRKVAASVGVQGGVTSLALSRPVADPTTGGDDAERA